MIDDTEQKPAGQPDEPDGAGNAGDNGDRRAELTEQFADLLTLAEERLGYHFHDRHYLLEALIHPSLVDMARCSYERMEFLGDAVLGLITAQHLYEKFPDSDEGELTRIKSAVVSRTALSRIGRVLGINDLLILGKGMMHQGPLPRSVAANATEALIGAVYLDGGLDPAQRFVLGHLGARIDRAVKKRPSMNHKSLLQQLTQSHAQGTPTYRVLSVSGPDHEKQFEICAVVQGREFPSAAGASKKIAEQRAARLALRILESELDEPGSATSS